MPDPLDEHIREEIADPLRAARGTLNACLVSAGFWLIVGMWFLTR